MPFLDKEYYDKKFERLNQAHTCFEHITFENCSFDSCQFNSASFIKCTFIECEFNACDLSLVSFKGSKLNEVVFNECKSLAVDWTLINWPNIALDGLLKFHNTVLDDSSFYGLNLRGIELVKCRSYDVDFREGDFSKSNFTQTDFSNSLFSQTNLCQVNFSDASNYDINFEFNTIKGATFSRLDALRLLHSLQIEIVD